MSSVPRIDVGANYYSPLQVHEMNDEDTNYTNQHKSTPYYDKIDTEKNISCVDLCNLCQKKQH